MTGTAKENKEQLDEHLRMVEALLFAASEPLSVEDISERLPDGADVEAHIETIRNFYEGRGVHLVKLAGKWLFSTAPELSFLLRKEVEAQRKLSRAGIETLAIIAYHQPVTRAEIEEIRGVGLSKGTLDVLMEAGWIKLKGRRRTPGRPVTYGTSEEFLVHFGLENVDDLPGIEELKAAGLLDSVDKALSRMEQEMIRQKEVDEAQIEIEDAIDESLEEEVEEPEVEKPEVEKLEELEELEETEVEVEEEAKTATSTLDKIGQQMETLYAEEDE